MFEIRNARAEDQDSIRQIYISAVGPQRRFNEHWEQLIQAGGLLVAEMDDCIIGFGGIDVSATEQLKWLYLLPQRQGAGIGSQLLSRLESIDRKSTRLNSSHGYISYAVFCLKKKKKKRSPHIN